MSQQCALQHRNVKTITKIIPFFLAASAWAQTVPTEAEIEQGFRSGLGYGVSAATIGLGLMLSLRVLRGLRRVDGGSA